jgi:hypothetical protein
VLAHGEAQHLVEQFLLARVHYAIHAAQQERAVYTQTLNELTRACLSRECDLRVYAKRPFAVFASEVESIWMVAAGHVGYAASPLRENAMSEAVREILQRIQHLPEEDRLILEEQLTQLVERQWSQNGTEQPRYPLRGSVVRYDEPTEPVADDDWEAIR